ncbi:EamA family transporter [Verticiella sediminum]|uniref:EamA family transporter n=1 Tax=Verticiella sediminum TaxID=1247510 RepID=A0A556AY06_9BURK|nr:DMT family transporter [Verticiella sediminum]TSH97335.1 EamA family transporter [Verticiella sediminum]
MSLAALSLVVLAALIHASWNLLAKRAAKVGPAFVFAYCVASTLLYLPLVLWILWHDTMDWNWPVVACIVASGALHLVYSLCLQRGYQQADLSVVYPVARGTGPLISVVGAFLILDEPVTGAGLIGVLCVVAGIFLIATQGEWAKFRQPAAWVGVRWGVTTGLMIAAYTVVDGYGVKVLLVAPVVLDWFAGVVRMVMLAPFVLVRREANWEAMRGYWGLAFAVGLLAPLSYILVLQALQGGAPLSLVAPAREMSMMAGALLAMFFLKERVSTWRLAGCAVLITGVVLLASA